MENGSDWHSADIIAALKKRGLSVRYLSIEAGLKPGTLSEALRKHWPKGETIIANALDLDPRDIWPTRYASVKRPKSIKTAF